MKSPHPKTVVRFLLPATLLALLSGPAPAALRADDAAPTTVGAVTENSLVPADDAAKPADAAAAPKKGKKKHKKKHKKPSAAPASDPAAGAAAAEPAPAAAGDK